MAAIWACMEFIHPHHCCPPSLWSSQKKRLCFVCVNIATNVAVAVDLAQCLSLLCTQWTLSELRGSQQRSSALPGNRELKCVRTKDHALVLKQSKQNLWIWDVCIPPVFESPEGLIEAPMAECMPVSNSWFCIWIWKVPHRFLAWTLGPSSLWWLGDGVVLEDIGPKQCLFLCYSLACFCFLVLWYGQLLSATSSCRHGVLFQHMGLSKCRPNPRKPWAKINNSFPKACGAGVC